MRIKTIIFILFITSTKLYSQTSNDDIIPIEPAQSKQPEQTYTFSPFSDSDVTLSTQGLSDEYSKMFVDKKKELIDALNEYKISKALAPLKVQVVFSNGNGTVIVECNYNHEKVFTSNSDYVALSKQFQPFGRGISVMPEYELFYALSQYKFRVAYKGFYADNDILKFESEIKLTKSNGDCMTFYAYNSLSGMSYPVYFYKNVTIQFSGKIYETETESVSDMNKNKFFFLGKTTGLDGKKTGAYFFCKFFNIDIE